MDTGANRKIKLLQVKKGRPIWAPHAIFTFVSSSFYNFGPTSEVLQWQLIGPVWQIQIQCETYSLKQPKIPLAKDGLSPLPLPRSFINLQPLYNNPQLYSQMKPQFTFVFAERLRVLTLFLCINYCVFIVIFLV